MGQKHREIRKALKAETRALESQGWRSDEFGELKKRTTKAHARRWLAGLRRALDEITRSSLEAGTKLMEEMKPQMRKDVLNLAFKDVRHEMDREIIGY